MAHPFSKLNKNAPGAPRGKERQKNFRTNVKSGYFECFEHFELFSTNSQRSCVSHCVFRLFGFVVLSATCSENVGLPSGHIGRHSATSSPSSAVPNFETMVSGAVNDHFFCCCGAAAASRGRDPTIPRDSRSPVPRPPEARKQWYASTHVLKQQLVQL